MQSRQTVRQDPHLNCAPGVVIRQQNVQLRTRSRTCGLQKLNIGTGKSVPCQHDCVSPSGNRFSDLGSVSIIVPEVFGTVFRDSFVDTQPEHRQIIVYLCANRNDLFSQTDFCDTCLHRNDRERKHPMVDIVRTEHATEQPLKQIQIFVRRSRRTNSRHTVRVCRGGFLKSDCRSLHRIIPGYAAKLRRIALERLFDPIRAVDPVLLELAFVTSPLFVDVFIQPRIHAHQLTVSGLNCDIAADAAHGADGILRCKLPGPSGKAISTRSQRPYRAKLDCVATELRLEPFRREWRDDRCVTAILDGQLAVPGDLLRKPCAAGALNAPLTVEYNILRNRHSLRKVPLLIDKASDTGPVLEDHVLKRALTAAITYRTVQRVINQKELQDTVLCLFDLGRDSIHDHAFRHRDGTGGLDLVHLLDFDQAHSACPRRTQPWMVTEVRNIRSSLECRRDNQCPLRHRDCPPVDAEIYHLDGWQCRGVALCRCDCRCCQCFRHTCYSCTLIPPEVLTLSRRSRFDFQCARL